MSGYSGCDGCSEGSAYLRNEVVILAVFKEAVAAHDVVVIQGA
jgi:hypothetical protein